jgi:ferrous iron transport protein B
MALMFISIFWWATPLMDAVDAGFSLLSDLVEAVVPAGLARDLLTGGVIAGVGNVIIFLPQIVILFIFLALMEDSGYMARAAFIMDRMMKRIGLSGRSFIPLLGSFACAIPGIMATRTIANRKDRLATILVAPFMSCSARLPIYVLVTGAFFPVAWQAGLVVFAMYMLGILAAVGSAFLFKRVIFRGEPEPFVLELPPYRLPALRNVAWTVHQRAKSFLMRAGSTILAITVLLWVLMNFPRHPEIQAHYAELRAGIGNRESGIGESGSALDSRSSIPDPRSPNADHVQLAVQERSELLRASYAGRIGHLIEPVVRPLGFDWKIGIGLVASFAAREVLVSTLGVIYSIDEDVAGDQPATVGEAMRADTWPDGRPIFTPLVGFSILVFFVLACQCMSTLAVVHRETNSLRWPLFMFTYMTSLAYLASFLVYQVGHLLGLG